MERCWIQLKGGGADHVTPPHTHTHVTPWHERAGRSTTNTDESTLQTQKQSFVICFVAPLVCSWGTFFLHSDPGTL